MRRLIACFIVSFLLLPVYAQVVKKDSAFTAERGKRYDSSVAPGKYNDISALLSIPEVERQRRAYEQEMKEFKIKAVAGTIIALLLMSAYLFYMHYRSREIKQEMAAKEAIIRQRDIAAKEVIEAEENERRRIAVDLHDGVGQMLSAVKMNLSGLSDKLAFSNDADLQLFDKTVSLVDDSCREVRFVSHNMMPNVLLQSGLVAAVKGFTDKIDGNALKIYLHATQWDERLDPTIEAMLYRIIQEAVNNVTRHAAATQLDISLFKDDKEISVTVEDNGRGFNASLVNTTTGMGLKNITRRVEYLKGTVDFDTAPGKGTLIAVNIPYRH